MKLEGFDYDNPILISRGIRLSKWNCRIDGKSLAITVNWEVRKIVLKSPLFGRIESNLDVDSMGMSFEEWILDTINSKMYDDIPKCEV